MLKKFLLNSLSSFVGAWIALALFGIAAVLTVFALIGSLGNSTMEQVKRHSILYVQLSGVIEETEKANGLDYIELIQGNVEAPQTLDVLVSSIKEAAVNKDIDAIYLECGPLSAAPATLNALRSELADFRKSGKKIYAYADSYSMGDYFVATAADSLFLNSEGSIALQGISGTNLYMKDFFDKIGVQFEVVKVGTFKSAVEPFISNEMSQPARAQLDTLYGVMWDHIRNDIAQRRNIQSALIDTLINRDFLMLQDAAWLKSHKLVDRLVYERQMKDILAGITGQDSDDLNLISPTTLAAETDWGQAYDSKKQIAVLYATGEIQENNPEGIDCYTLVPEIVKLADDENVKGMVLRVNSPGGSVFGSEQIGEALDYFQSKGKTLAVSMGDYAASGGYWISCHADRIFADPMTITGSIGIFGLIPNVSGLTAKLGVTPQTVSTNPAANFPTFFYPMTEQQHAAMQSWVEKGYDKFITRVATGRKMSKQKVMAIAEGRVWSAITAHKIGLVDELGSLQKSIDWVAKQAKIETSYDVAVYPTLDDDLMMLLNKASQQSKAFQEFCQRLNIESADRVVTRAAFNILRRKPVQALAPAPVVRL